MPNKINLKASTVSLPDQSLLLILFIFCKMPREGQE